MEFSSSVVLLNTVRPSSLASALVSRIGSLASGLFEPNVLKEGEISASTVVRFPISLSHSAANSDPTKALFCEGTLASGLGIEFCFRSITASAALPLVGIPTDGDLPSRVELVWDAGAGNTSFGLNLLFFEVTCRSFCILLF